MKLKTIRKIKFWTQLILSAGMLFIVFVEYVRPVVSAWYYEDEFSKMALACDQAMHDEVVLRDSPAGIPIDKNLEISGMVGLSVCHQYDLLRKQMMINGVSEEKLALIGLQGLENEQIPVSRMVSPHRMDRF